MVKRKSATMSNIIIMRGIKKRWFLKEVSVGRGLITAYALLSLEPRGTLFVNSGMKSKKMAPPYRVMLHNDNAQVPMKVIPGMTVDIDVNVMQEAHHNRLEVVIICDQVDAEDHYKQLRVISKQPMSFAMRTRIALVPHIEGFVPDHVSTVVKGTPIMCEALGQVVLDWRSQDNITIVIADFGRTNWQSVPVQQQNIIFELGQAFVTLGIVSFGIWMTSMLGS
ncbi:hypothetical protein AgCh_011467 [Apium graveolens]